MAIGIGHASKILRLSLWDKYESGHWLTLDKLINTPLSVPGNKQGRISLEPIDRLVSRYLVE